MSNSWAARGAAILVAALLVPAAARGQVGHDPGRSPFRDITTRQGMTVLAGRFAGNRAEAGVGARSGPMVGVRFETRLSGPLDFTATVVRIGSSRLVVNPTVDPDSAARVSGPIDMALLGFDVAFTLNITGAKTWRGLAPYVSVGAGVLAPTETVQDPGGYKAGSNYVLVPAVGLRWYASRRLALRFEARDHYLRYEWPRAYFFPTDANNNPLPPVLSNTGNEQWTHNTALSIGLQYAFTF